MARFIAKGETNRTLYRALKEKIYAEAFCRRNVNEEFVRRIRCEAHAATLVHNVGATYVVLMLT
jgi:hypothetical protein